MRQSRSDPAVDTREDRLHEVALQYLEKFDWADPDAIEVHIRMTAAWSAMSSGTQRLLVRLGQRRTPGRFGALRAIYFAPDRRLTQTEIGEQINVAPPNVTYIVDGLEAEGLAQRLPEPSNRRITWVELTPAGLELCELLVPAMTAHMSDLLQGFSPDEKRQFNDFLARLQRNAEVSQREE